MKIHALRNKSQNNNPNPAFIFISGLILFCAQLLVLNSFGNTPAYFDFKKETDIHSISSEENTRLPDGMNTYQKQVGDGITVRAAAIQKANDDGSVNKKGCMVFINGGAFVSEPCGLKDEIAQSEIYAETFSLTCNGKNVPVLEQNDVPYSYGLNAYKYARVTYTGNSLSINITVNDFDFSNTDWEILPSGYDLKGIKSKNRLRFDIDHTGYIVVRFKKNQDFTKRLVIFIEPLEQLPNLEMVNIVQSYGVDSTGANNETVKIQKALDEIAGTGKVLYFPPGSYKSFMLNINSNSNIHLAKNARIIADVSSIESYQDKNGDGPNRFILIRNSYNIHITGYGAFDGNGTYFRGIYDPSGSEGKGGMRLLYMVNSKNISFDGIVLKDAARWNTQITGCEDITFRNCKMMNNPNNNRNLTNFDGWDPDASKRVLIENCFGWAGDDNVAIKCVGTGKPKIISNVEDITIKGCVFLTKKSALKIGTETRCGTIKNVLFENNDVIEADRVIAIDVKDNAIVDGVKYINCRSEFSFPDSKQMGINIFLKKRNDDQTYIGKIQNVLIESCTFQTKFPNGFRIYRDPEQTVISDLQVTIKNLSVAGKEINHLDPDYFNRKECNGEIIFKNEMQK